MNPQTCIVLISPDHPLPQHDWIQDHITPVCYHTQEDKPLFKTDPRLGLPPFVYPNTHVKGLIAAINGPASDLCDSVTAIVFNEHVGLYTTRTCRILVPPATLKFCKSDGFRTVRQLTEVFDLFRIQVEPLDETTTRLVLWDNDIAQGQINYHHIWHPLGSPHPLPVWEEFFDDYSIPYAIQDLSQPTVLSAA